MRISDFYYGRLGRMLKDPTYEIGARYIPKLLDAGFIKEIKWTATGDGIHLDCSCYGLTESGIKAYKDWEKQQKIKPHVCTPDCQNPNKNC